jgi:hypothetical protein
MASNRLNELENERKRLNDIQESLKNINDIDSKRLITSQQIANYQKLINEAIKDESLTVNEINKKVIEYDAELKQILEKEKELNKQLERQIDKKKLLVNLTRELGNQLKIGWKYLQDQDKIIKSTNLNLGLSGVKADAMRKSFEDSAVFVSRLSGNLGDIQTIMTTFSEETGRARALTAEMVRDVTLIGKGTGLGIEQASKLGAQFEMMGVDTKKTVEFVQGIVDTSERMGVNTTKVMRSINDNFKKLNTYTFQQGTKGMSQMASYAEKFKIDIGQALNAVDVARTLEGAIDLTAQLQVMGGEFAKTDPFEMLFLSRNDPAKFTEKIGDMTKGLVSFRKMADGSFEKFISPADRDRIAAVAKSMGMEASQLTDIAQKQAEIQKIRQQTAGMGLSKEQQDAIEGAAIFDSKTGKFQVKLGETLTNIGNLTKDQTKQFIAEKNSLEERAKNAQTFNETLNNTIEMLKSSLLPVLRLINKVAEFTVKPLANLAEKGWGGLATTAGILLAAGVAWKFAAFTFNNAMTNWANKDGARRTIGGMLGGGRSTIPGQSLVPEIGKGSSGLGQLRAGQGALAAGKGAGLSALGKGAGVGVAAAGIGAGIGAAAVGIGQLAKAIKDIDIDKLKVMNYTIGTIGLTMTAILVPAIFAVGAAGTAGSIGLLAVGAAALGVGAGIGIAAWGIGEMASGLGNLIEKGKGSGTELLKLAGGIGAINLALASSMGGIFGLPAFAATMATISSFAPDIKGVGDAFGNIAAVLSGTKEDWIAVENAVKSISQTNVSNGSVFSELSNLLKQPLKVTFDNSNVTLKNNITLEIDRTTFMNKIYDSKIAVQLQNETKTRGI